MTQYTISVQEKWGFYKMIINIGSQPQVHYNHLTIDEVIRFIQSHQELLTVETDKKDTYDKLQNKFDYNVLLQS